MARPTKGTPDAQARILEAIRLGATYEMAAKAGGISYDTLNEWRKQFSEFSEALHAAEAEAATRWLQAIDAAMPKHWQAAAWMLERHYPHHYGKQRMEQSGTLEVHVTYTNDWRSTGIPQQANSTDAPCNTITSQ